MQYDYQKMFSVEGRVALVTDASAGIGVEIATTLAEAGADVAICARSVDRLEKLAAELKESTGKEVRPYALDVTKEESVKLVLPRSWKTSVKLIS